MKVFVAGGTGVIGRASVSALVEAGHRVRSTARGSDKHELVRSMGAEPVEVDLYDPRAVRQAIAGSDAVIRLTTKIPSLMKMRDMRTWSETNRLRTEGARILVDAAIAERVPAYIHESVTFVYRDGGANWLPEDSPVDDGGTPILRGALEGEQEAARFSQAGGRGIILRFGGLYGAGARSTLEMITMARRRMQFQIGPGSSYFSSIYVPDAGRAVAAAIQAPSGIYNVCDDRPVVFSDYLRLLAAAIAAPKPLQLPAFLGKWMSGEISRYLTRSQRVSTRGSRRSRIGNRPSPACRKAGRSSSRKWIKRREVDRGPGVRSSSSQPLSMKAMILRATRDVAPGQVERPSPAHDQVLVRMTHSGICGTDRKIFDGDIPVRHPLIMGHEMAGELADGGGHVIVDPCLYCGACFYCRAGLTSLCPHGGLIGRDVDGGFAEYVVAPRSHVFPLPDSIDSRCAPLIQVVTTCVHSQRQINILAGQSVVVVGLGVTGQVHAQLAKARGAHPVIGISRSAWKRKMAEQLGADLTLAGGEAGVRAVMEATKGRGADVVIESTGFMPTVADAISMCRMGATLLLFGIITESEGALPFYQIYFKELTIVNGRAAKGEDFPASIDLVARGAIKLDPLITHVVPVAELGTAMEMLTSDADRRMKIILENEPA